MSIAARKEKKKKTDRTSRKPSKKLGGLCIEKVKYIHYYDEKILKKKEKKKKNKIPAPKNETKGR